MGIYRRSTPEFEAREVFRTTDWTNWKPIMEWIDAETTMAMLDKDNKPYGIMFTRQLPHGGAERIWAVEGSYICKNDQGIFYVMSSSELDGDQYEFVRMGPDQTDIDFRADISKAICDTCGRPKSLSAIGELCNSTSCTGTVIANPALETQ